MMAHWLISRTSPGRAHGPRLCRSRPPLLGPYRGEVLLTELTTGQVQAMFTAIIRQHQALCTPVSAATFDPDSRHFASRFECSDPAGADQREPGCQG
jgi:hypothetical protein